MAKRVKKVAKKRVRKVKMQPRIGYVWVDSDGFAWVNATWQVTESGCAGRASGCSYLSKYEGSPCQTIIVPNTPANRKRLGVKRG